MKKNKLYIVIGIVFIFLLITFCVKLLNKNNIKKVHFTPSNNITIRYAYGIGISTIEQKNNQEPYLDIVKISVKGNDLTRLKRAIKNNSFILDKSIDSAGVAGEYELTIGDEVVFFDQEEGIYTKDKKQYYKIDISTELFDEVSDIVFNYVNSKQEIIKTDTIYIKNSELGEVTFTDKNEVKEIINIFRYVKLKSKSDELYEESNYIDFGNGIIITLYENSNIASYKNNNTGEDINILLYINPVEPLKNLIRNKIILDEGERAASQ